MINRREFLLSGAAFLLAGCSSKINHTPNYIDKKNEILSFYKYIRGSHFKSLNKLEKVGIFLNSQNYIGLRHTLVWDYGPSLTISKENYLILKFAEENTLFQGLGLKDNLNFIMNNFYKNNSHILENVNELGYKDLMSLFLRVYDNLTNSTEIEFELFISSLSENNINYKRLKNKDLNDFFFRSYLFYGDDTGYVIFNGKKTYADLNDFTAYAATLSIVIELLDKNKSSGEIYAI